jgi:two-component system nitrate/nitrite response regulator NarL
MTEITRIIIADDHPLFREGVAHTLNSEPDLEIVGKAETGEEAIQLVTEFLPDIVLLDITMSEKDGITTAREISSTYPVVRIIMLTASENEDDLLNALKAGAVGYIVKGIHAQELAKAVRSVVNGDIYISPSLASALLLDLAKPREPGPLNELTEREKGILGLVAEGLTNREIGVELHLAEKTIKHYMTNILQKLHVRSRVEAALIMQKQKMNQER